VAMGAPPTRFERAELRGEDTGLLVAQDGGVPCAGVPNVLTRSTVRELSPPQNHLTEDFAQAIIIWRVSSVFS